MLAIPRRSLLQRLHDVRSSQIARRSLTDVPTLEIVSLQDAQLQLSG